MTFTTKKHIVRRFDEDLASLLGIAMEMGKLVEQQIVKAIQALKDGDTAAAHDVIEQDSIVNDLDIKADEACTNLIARRQPLSTDLRTVMAVSKAVTDLERIGDEATEMAQLSVSIHQRNKSDIRQGNILRDLQSMSKQATAILREALAAMAELNPEAASQVIKKSDQMDEDFQDSVRCLSTYAIDANVSIGDTVDLIFILKSLKRIVDHSQNIAEYVIYMIKGKDVRHIHT